MVSLQRLSLLLAAFDRFGASLDDVEPPIFTIPGPLNIHGPAVMLLDDKGLAGKRLDLLVVDAELSPFLFLYLYGPDASGALVPVHHLDGLGAEGPPQDGMHAIGECRLVNVKFIRVDSALDNGFAQSPG